MKRLSLAIVIFLCASSAMASGYYMVPYGDGTYRAVNAAGENDGWVWESYRSCGCKYKCGCALGYRKVRKLEVITHVDGWEKNAINATYRAIDKQYFLKSQALLASLAPDGYQQGYNSQQYAYSTVQRGVGIYPQQYNQLDANALGHSLERVTLRMTDTAGQSVAALGAATQQAVESNKQIMLYQAFAQSVQPQPTSETHYYQQSGGQSSSSGSYGVGGGQDPIHAMRSLAGASAVRACAACHSGPNAKADLDLASIDSYITEDRELIAEEAISRMIGEKSKDPSTRMPPKGEGVAPDVAYAIADHIRGKPQAQPQRQYRPRVQAQEQPNGDPPPIPNPPVQE